MAINPQLVIELTNDQKEAIRPLLNKRLNQGGMIIGSISTTTGNEQLHLSHSPTELSRMLVLFAEEHKSDLEEKPEELNGRN